jgi:hypothetical protein
LLTTAILFLFNFRLLSLILKGVYVVLNNKKGRTILTLILVYFRFEIANKKLKQIIKKSGVNLRKKRLIF